MRRYIQSFEIANEMGMRRSKFKGLFVVVEGVTDFRLYGKFSNPAECQMVIAHSKDNVRIAVKEMREVRGDSLTTGIIDQDYDLLLGKEVEENLFMTDCHDLETLLMRSSALDAVLWEYGDRDEIALFEKRTGMTVREALLNATIPLGTLMFISLRNGYNLSFKEIDHHSFVDPVRLCTDIQRMVESLCISSDHHCANPKTLVREIKAEISKGHDPWVICRGHDMVAILLIALHETIGLYNARTLGKGMLAGILRLAYTADDFKTTKLYKDMMEWGRSIDIEIWQ